MITANYSPSLFRISFFHIFFLFLFAPCVLSLPASACASVHPCYICINRELVLAITFNPFKLGSQNSDQRCNTPSLWSLLFIYSFIYSFIHLFIYLFVYLFIYLLFFFGGGGDGVCVCVTFKVKFHLKVIFYPIQFRAVNFVRAVTHHPFKLGSLNWDQRHKTTWLRSLLF